MSDWLLYLAFAMSCAPLAFFWCCDCGCSIYSDHFTTDRLATKWDQRSGTWTVAGGVLEVTDAGVIVTTTAAPVGVDAIHLTVEFITSDPNGQYRLIFAYVDDDNYWFAQVDLDAETLSIWERTAGVETERDSTTIPSDAESGSLTACYSEDRIIATFQSGDDSRTAVYHATLAVEGTFAGLAVVATATASFDDFAYSKHFSVDSTCPQCELLDCQCCEDGQPEQWQLEISGLADGTFGGSSCTDCDELNGTYILTKFDDCTANYLTGSEQFCGSQARFFLEVVHTPSLGTDGSCNIQIRVQSLLDPTKRLHINTFSPGAATPLIKLDCRNMVDEACIITQDGVPCDLISGPAIASLTSL